MEMLFIYITIGVPLIGLIAVTIDFVHLVSNGREFYVKGVRIAYSILFIIVFPLLFLSYADGGPNDCCGQSPFFSPDHRLTIYLWMAACTLTCLYCQFRQKIAPPIPEVFANTLLTGGIVLNILMVIQHPEFPFQLFHIPIILIFVNALIRNQLLFLRQKLKFNPQSNGGIAALAYQFLGWPPLFKFTALFILLLPLTIIVTAFLLLFGQQPDSQIRVFTDTYKHGFSQLDHLCDNVQCGGHYLCSVAAKGHPQIVKPQRLGIRGGKLIICNRQLLIANAFEGLIQKKLPKTHKVIRRNYNKVGNAIHQHYHLFSIKWISDLIYLLMKPLEWFFLLVLYCCDRSPESRISEQYIARGDDGALQSLIHQGNDSISNIRPDPDFITC